MGWEFFSAGLESVVTGNAFEARGLLSYSSFTQSTESGEVFVRVIVGVHDGEQDNRIRKVLEWLGGSRRDE